MKIGVTMAAIVLLGFSFGGIWYLAGIEEQPSERVVLEIEETELPVVFADMIEINGGILEYVSYYTFLSRCASTVTVTNQVIGDGGDSIRAFCETEQFTLRTVLPDPELNVSDNALKEWNVSVSSEGVYQYYETSALGVFLALLVLASGGYGIFLFVVKGKLLEPEATHA